MTQSEKARKDAKRDRRQAVIVAKREAQRRSEAQRRRRSWAIYGGIAAAVIVVAGLGVWSSMRGRSPAGPAPSASGQMVVETYPDQGTAHIRLGDAHPAYNSNPPTSGWHTPQTVPWGARRDAIPDEVVIHNLEHGGIWISYKDPTDTALVEKLEALASRYRSKVIVTPRPQNDAPIAVVAWTKLMKLQAFDEAAIVKFIDAYKNKGPEQVPD
jgi:hypothetical protein